MKPFQECASTFSPNQETYPMTDRAPTEEARDISLRVLECLIETDKSLVAMFDHRRRLLEQLVGATTAISELHNLRTLYQKRSEVSQSHLYALEQCTQALMDARNFP